MANALVPKETVLGLEGTETWQAQFKINFFFFDSWLLASTTAKAECSPFPVPLCVEKQAALADFITEALAVQSGSLGGRARIPETQRRRPRQCPLG